MHLIVVGKFRSYIENGISYRLNCIAIVSCWSIVCSLSWVSCCWETAGSDSVLSRYWLGCSSAICWDLRTVSSSTPAVAYHNSNMVIQSVYIHFISPIHLHTIMLDMLCFSCYVKEVQCYWGVNQISTLQVK